MSAMGLYGGGGGGGGAGEIFMGGLNAWLTVAPTVKYPFKRVGVERLHDTDAGCFARQLRRFTVFCCDGKQHF